MRLNLKYIALLILPVLMATGGCSSSRRAAETYVTSTVTGKPEVRFDSLLKSEHRWNTVEVPVGVKLKTPISMSFSGKAYMEKDRSLFISLRKLGFEVAQLWVNPDTIMLVDKFNKRYLLENISALAPGQPVTVADIQNLLLARPFLIGEKISAKKFNFFETQAEWTAVPRNEDSSFAVGFNFSEKTNAMVAAAAKVFTLVYSEPFDSGNGILPGSETLNISAGKAKVNAEIEFDWGSARWDSPDGVRAPSLPRSSYTRLSAAQLLKGLGSY